MFYRKPLYYGFNKLEPFIDTATMDEHYNKHYKKYEENLNQALVENNIREDDIQVVLRNFHSIPKIRNNGGGFYNHLLYFDNISPYHNDYNQNASQELKMMINQTFGSYENFKSQFIKAGSDLFGSGWVWLLFKDGKLMIATTKNQDNPIMQEDYKILLGMDVWEHAYYLKHKSNRKAYIEDFFKTIDWSIVRNRLN
jgi:Fe-Mn family superoxide dismutase